MIENLAGPSTIELGREAIREERVSATPEPEVPARAESHWWSRFYTPPTPEDLNDRRAVLLESRRKRLLRNTVESKLAWHAQSPTVNETTIYVNDLSKKERSQLPAAAERLYQARRAGDKEEEQRVMAELGGGIPYDLLSHTVDTVYPQLSQSQARNETSLLTPENDEAIADEAKRTLLRPENIRIKRLATNLQLAGFSTEEARNLSIRIGTSQLASWAMRGISTGMPALIAAHEISTDTPDNYPYPLKLAAALALQGAVAWVSQRTVKADMHLLREANWCPEPAKIVARELSNQHRPGDEQLQEASVTATHWTVAQFPPRIAEEGGYAALAVASPEAAILANLWSAVTLEGKNIAQHMAAEIVAVEKGNISLEETRRATRAVFPAYERTRDIYKNTVVPVAAKTWNKTKDVYTESIAPVVERTRKTYRKWRGKEGQPIEVNIASDQVIE